MYRVRSHRSWKMTKDGTRGGPAIYDTYGIFEHDQCVIAGTPGRHFPCPNAPIAPQVAPALIMFRARAIWIFRDFGDGTTEFGRSS